MVVAVVGSDLHWLARDVVRRAGDRYEVRGDPGGDAEIVVIGPRNVSGLARVRHEAGDAVVLVVDWRTVIDPAGIVASFDVGVDAFVTTHDADVVVAHLDALARRCPRP
jgi:hypothetical protein